MNIFEKLRILLKSDNFSREDFQSFLRDNLPNNRTNHIGLRYLLIKIREEFKTKRTISVEDVQSNPTLLSFIKESPRKNRRSKSLRPIKKEQVKLHDNLISGSKKKPGRLSKSQRATLNRLKGTFQKTPNQRKAQKENEKRKKKLKSLPISTKHSIWTVKK